MENEVKRIAEESANYVLMTVALVYGGGASYARARVPSGFVVLLDELVQGTYHRIQSWHIVNTQSAADDRVGYGRIERAGYEVSHILPGQEHHFHVPPPAMPAYAPHAAGPPPGAAPPPAMNAYPPAAAAYPAVAPAPWASPLPIQGVPFQNSPHPTIAQAALGAAASAAPGFTIMHPMWSQDDNDDDEYMPDAD